VPLDVDMCVNTCLAFTGPFDHLKTCPTCGESHYDPFILASSNGKKKISCQKFSTIPLSPQLQVLCWTPQASANMRYRWERTEEIIAQIQENSGQIMEFNDYCHGQEYLNAVFQGDILANDIVILLSLNGAQLYKNKTSDCWIYIWVILNYSPELRYKKQYVLSGGFIPSPNKPKNVDSFLFPSIHHLAGLQREGLCMWDAINNRVFKSFVFFAFGTADMPGMTYLSGLVGHSGAFGCCLYCPVKGRLRGRSYYPTHLKPDNYHTRGSDHEDVDL
jgi:hypothetical protein